MGISSLFLAEVDLFSCLSSCCQGENYYRPHTLHSFIAITFCLENIQFTIYVVLLYGFILTSFINIRKALLQYFQG